MTTGQFKEVLKLLAKVTNLEITDKAVEPIGYEGEIGFKLGFDSINLTSFLFTSLLGEDEGLHQLTEIIKRSINLGSLSLVVGIICPTFIPIQVCPTLQTLSIRTDLAQDILDLNQSILPLSSIHKLKKLTYSTENDQETSPNLLKLIQNYASSLEELDLQRAH